MSKKSPEIESAFQRAELIMGDFRNLVEGQLNGSIDMIHARAWWKNLLTKHKDDPDALAEVLTWSLHHKLVITQEQLLDRLRPR